MSETAFDIADADYGAGRSIERPDSDYELSPAALKKLCLEGRKAWLQINDDPPDLPDVVWHLLSEAADTLRAIKRDAPSLFKSAWPDFNFTDSDLLFYENQTLADARESAAQERVLDPDLYAVRRANIHTATAAALNRMLPSLSLLRWVRAKSLHQKKRRMRFILALAGGMSPTKAAGMFPELGYQTKGAVLAAAYRSRLAICERIERKCGRFVLIEDSVNFSVDKRDRT